MKIKTPREVAITEQHHGRVTNKTGNNETALDGEEKALLNSKKQKPC